MPAILEFTIRLERYTEIPLTIGLDIIIFIDLGTNKKSYRLLRSILLWENSTD